VKLVRVVLVLLLLCATSMAHTVVRASHYAAKFRGRITKSGHRYNPAAYTAAHRTMPLGSVLHVCNVSTDKCVDVQVNDRGPHTKRFGIDLSMAAARAIGIRHGWAWVSIEIKGKESEPMSCKSGKKAVKKTKKSSKK
jgi:rare lipoprotein A